MELCNGLYFCFVKDDYHQALLQRIPVLVANRIPVVMVLGGSDMIVPYEVNGALL